MSNTTKSSFGDFSGAITAIAEEKGIDKSKILETVEAAIAAAYKREYGKKGQNIRAEFNAVSGDMKFFLIKEVVDESVRDFVNEEETSVESVDFQDEDRKPRFNAERDILLTDALKKDTEVKVGDFIEEELPSHTDFGRVAAQTAKQVIIQRIREAEREAMFDEYKEKEGEIVSGVVQRIEGRLVYVDLGKSVGVLFPREQVKGEYYNVGQRIKVYLESVDSDSKGPGIKLSRVHTEMVRQLFENEVPEIFSGTVEIKAIAREAGSRTKIAVWTEEEGIDPIGSCVGQKGSRVSTIIEELGGEKIDIIEWNPKIEEFISASLSPAKVLRVDLDEVNKKARVVVPEDQLSLAIGKKGQNVRLAVKLTGWDLDVETFNGKEKVEIKEENSIKEVKENLKVEEEKQEIEKIEEKNENVKEIEEVEEKPKKVRKSRKKAEK